MKSCIWLTDVDRPEESLQAEIVEIDARTLRLAVPNTNVEFFLRRNNGGLLYEGALGGRYFVFDPQSLGPRVT